MAIDFDSIQTITDAQMLKAVRYAISQVLVGGASVSALGRTFTRANLAELRKMEADLIAATNDDGNGGIAIVQFGER